jgi:hypothetical protein
MPTEVWFRNPHLYIKELVECGEYRIVWDRGLLVKRHIDAHKHASIYFGQAYPWRLLLVGEQGTAELDAEHDLDNPKAVYPTWQYGEEFALLEEIIEYPVGQDSTVCNDKTVPVDQLPVFGQEHRVVITNQPPSHTGPGRQFLRHVKELQEDYPDCIIHLHGTYSFRSAFGLGFRAADMEPRTAAAKGRVYLPSGKEEKYEQVVKHPHWVTQLGFKPVELSVPRVRCMYNIKSAVWAGANYDKLYNFAFKPAKDHEVDTTSPTADVVPITTKSHIVGAAKPKSEADMFQCDTCSLQDKCKYFRAGAVCSVPGAEPTELSRYFKTRDSGMIIDGLGTLLAAQTHRLQRGMRDEDTFGELDPEVTKIMNGIFDQGVKLAKLVDPSLRGSGVNINVGQGGQAQVAVSTPKQMVAAAVRELQARGVPLEEITPEAIQGLLAGMADPEKADRAIESKVVDQDGKPA